LLKKMSKRVRLEEESEDVWIAQLNHSVEFDQVIGQFSSKREAYLVGLIYEMKQNDMDADTEGIEEFINIIEKAKWINFHSLTAENDFLFKLAEFYAKHPQPYKLKIWSPRKWGASILFDEVLDNLYNQLDEKKQEKEQEKPLKD